MTAAHKINGSSGAMVTAMLWAGLALAAAAAIADAAGWIAADALSLTLAILTLFVAAIVASFSRRYMRADPGRAGYFASLGALVASVAGFLFSGNVVIFGLAWLTSGALLARLIGHDANWSQARAAARRTRLAFLIGDVALIVALALLAARAGSLSLTDAVAAGAAPPAPLGALTALLLLIAAAARCALPPFSGWLLSSMTAPTSVSALMHAGLVNAGGFLLIRFAPVLEATPAVRLATIALGLLAAIWGIGVMIVRPDVKRSLAGSTVSQMGFMIMSCGLGAYAAALWHLVAHGLFKAWLFLGSGSGVGMKGGPASALLTRGTAVAIGGGVLAVGIALAIAGNAGAALIPLLLGLATAVATLLATVRAGLSAASRLAVAGLIAALAGAQAIGLVIVSRALGVEAPAAIPAWGMALLLAVFVAAWLWQQVGIAERRPLPPRLYVHLLNAGAL